MKKIKKEQLIEEWDQIALDRYNDLSSSIDSSYNTILRPALIASLRVCNLNNVLDVGCGVGVLTSEVSKISKHLTAIDISNQSIKIARAKSNKENINYINIDIEDFQSEKSFDTIFSNMTLMTLQNLEDSLKRIKKLLTKNGSFVFTITHPSFWPIYWNYNSPNFNYNLATAIEREFKISQKVYYGRKTVHYHRPLETYINLLSSLDMKISEFRELVDKEPKDGVWYPRFLLISCTVL